MKGIEVLVRWAIAAALVVLLVAISTAPKRDWSWTPNPIGLLFAAVAIVLAVSGTITSLAGRLRRRGKPGPP